MGCINSAIQKQTEKSKKIDASVNVFRNSTLPLCLVDCGARADQTQCQDFVAGRRRVRQIYDCQANEVSNFGDVL